MREIRNPDLKTKPHAHSWFEKNESARWHFEITRDFLISIYQDENHGFIDRNAAPEYRFNSHGIGYTTITASTHHSTVRIVLPRKMVQSTFRKRFCTTRKSRHGEDYDIVLFRISDAESLNELKSFFENPYHDIENFSRQLRREIFKGQSNEDLDNQVKALLKKGLEKPSGSKTPTYEIRPTKTFIRDPKVVAWVLREVKGICECCGKNAPFVYQDGGPFLEVHHLKGLAYGGSDTIENAVAVCPNCHRELHFGERKITLLNSMYRKISRQVRE